MFALQAQMARAAAPKVETPQPTDPNACPKCGRVLTRGRHLHVKYCKGR